MSSSHTPAGLETFVLNPDLGGVERFFDAMASGSSIRRHGAGELDGWLRKSLFL